MSGCVVSKPTSDPLAGWHFYSRTKISQAITQDYQDYIQTLPAAQKYFVGRPDFFENEIGQHAVKIEIDLNGTWREHILIYDANNKRIQVIKYKGGTYRS